MAFDPKVAEAQIALNMIGTTDMPRLAWDALEAGFDGSAIRRLAALEFPTYFEVRAVLPRAMQEMQMVKLTPEAAALQLARLCAGKVLSGEDDPLEHLGYFAHLWIKAGYPSILTGAGELEEEVYLARESHRPESEIRSFVLGRLQDLTRP